MMAGRDPVEHLMAITNCQQRELASSILEASGGDMEQAVEIFFDEQEVKKETAGAPGGGAGLVQPAGGTRASGAADAGAGPPARKRLRRDAEDVEVAAELTGEEARCFAELKDAVGGAAMSMGVAGGSSGVVPDQVLREVVRRLPADAAELGRVAGMAGVEAYQGVILAVVGDYRRDGRRGVKGKEREEEGKKRDRLKLYHYTRKAGLDDIIKEGAPVKDKGKGKRKVKVEVKVEVKEPTWVVRAKDWEGRRGVHLATMDPTAFTRGEVAKQMYPESWREKLEDGEVDFWVEVWVDRADEKLERSGEMFLYHGDLGLEEGGWRSGRMEVEQVRRLFHYTNATSLSSITKDGRIKASPGGAAGEGVYFTCLPPTEFTREELSTNNYGAAGRTDRTECWLQVDVDQEDRRLERCKIDDREILIYRGDMVREHPRL